MSKSHAWLNPDVKKIFTEILEELLPEYPQLTYNDILEIVDSEFKMCKEEISKGDKKVYSSLVKEIWLQYFATFVVRKEECVARYAAKFVDHEPTSTVQ